MIILPGLISWGKLILSGFQNQFCACSAQPGPKIESGFLFNTNMPEPLWVGECFILMVTHIKVTYNVLTEIIMLLCGLLLVEIQILCHKINVFRYIFMRELDRDMVI